ncbi:SEN2 subunit of the tRNA splicing endonuclease-like protein [Lipomyces japonicus]|uniref:SEN2 subunit of the tRNA splicing endonuclease-like protein n=1 Tax=Lipomyces japonicus TaxID=56871 RepID=UPI0034CEC9D9
MKKRQLGAIYKSPLPVEVVTLPPIVPHNPLSLAHYAYHMFVVPLIWNYKQRHRYVAYLHQYKDATSSYVSAIEVESDHDMTALWQNGFFGKGTQSRSEPTWGFRTARRLDVASEPGQVAPEDITAKRREIRRKFKSARALAEGEAQFSHGRQDSSSAAFLHVPVPVPVIGEPEVPPVKRVEDTVLVDFEGKLKRLEKLQLTFQEAFFLSYGLGCLDVYDDNTGDLISVPELLGLLMPDARPDNSFIINYVVYHHYRSHGWCIRDGVKFGVDYLLYRRGPPFSHAEFGIIVIPVYQDESRNKAVSKDWWWSSGVNRIVGGVKKTMIFCYVEIPEFIEEFQTVDELLSKYRIREVSFRRWIPNRHRD